MRFKEEITILREEQRRVLVCLEKNALIWEARAATAKDCVDDPLLLDGLAAYAAKQAALQKAWASHFSQLWKPATSHQERTADDGRELDQESCIRYSFGGDGSDDEVGHGGMDSDPDSD
jgi:hypothetical protein